MPKAPAKPRSVYDHIWRSIAAVVALVFVLGGTAITIYVDKSITTQIEERENSYLAGVDAMLSHQLSSTQQTLNMLLTNPFIVQSIYTGNQSWSASVYQSGQTIVNAVNSNQLYNSIYVIAGDSIAIKSSRRYQDKSAEAMLIDTMRHDFRRVIKPWRAETGSRISHNLMMISALDTVSTPNATGGALINLDLDRLAAMAFSNHGGSEVCLVLNEQIIASTDLEHFFRPLAEHPLLPQAVRTGARLIDGYYVFSRANDTYGYTVYSIQDRAQLMTPVKTGLLILLGAISLLLIVTLLISRRAALLAYTPVKTILIQLEEQLPAGAEASGEELGELQRVSHSIRRTSEIVSAYRHNADTARLNRFIHNGDADHSIGDMLSRLVDYTGQEPLYMLLFQADIPNDARMAADVLQGYLDGDADFLTLDMPGQRLMSLVCLHSDAKTAHLDQIVAQMLESLSAQDGGKVVMALMQAEDGVDSLPGIYALLTERMNRRVFCAHSALLTPPLSAKVPADMMQQVCHTAQAMDSVGYMQAVTTCLEACRQVSAQEAYHQLTTLCMRLHEAGTSRSMDVADRLDSYRTIQRELFALNDYAAIVAYMQNLYQRISDHISLRKAGEGNPLAERIQAYVNEHYADPALSAGQVAEALGISVSHLSRVMSRSLGCGFPELLNSVRLTHATLLLNDPGISIAQLAQQCGFSSASYFTASFKRVYGMTPSSYRAQQMNEAEKK